MIEKNLLREAQGERPAAPRRSFASDISAAALVALSLVFPAEEALAERRVPDLSGARLPPVPAQVHDSHNQIRSFDAANEERYLREIAAPTRDRTPVGSDIEVEYGRLGPFRGVAGKLDLEHVQENGSGSLHGKFNSENPNFESYEFKTPAELKHSENGISISIGGANINLDLPIPIPIRSKYKFTLMRDSDGDPKLMLEVKIKSNSVKVTHTLYF